mgnify:CR=1 FL=1
MAGIFFTAGETKKRPGVFQRYEQGVSSLYSGAQDGVVAALIGANWGELGKVYEIGSEPGEAESAFGSGDGVDVINEIFNGGAKKVYGVRVGSGGTSATAILKDTTATPVNAVNVTAKYVGNRAFKFLLRAVVGDAMLKEFVLSEGGVVLEKIRFAVSTSGEVDALIAAGANSAYLVFAKSSGYSGTGALAVVSTETAFTAGTDPTITTASYSAGMLVVEPYRFNSICVDTVDTAVHALLTAYLSRVYQDGKTGFAVVGEPVSVALATRQSNAAAFNSYNAAYVGGGWYDSSNKLFDGFLAAARIAGMIAATPSNKAITHKAIAGAVSAAEKLTNSQFETCISKGMITFSESPSGTVWVEQGITTLISPSGNDDAGWKKIKRSKVRFELFDRVNDTVAPLMGQVNNNADGRAAVIQLVNGVLLAMANEGKIETGYEVIEDSSNPATGESAWFLIGFKDVDALEKVYLVYKVGGFAPKA